LRRLAAAAPAGWQPAPHALGHSLIDEPLVDPRKLDFGSAKLPKRPEKGAFCAAHILILLSRFPVQIRKSFWKGL
jgi:hypothetical protein